MADGRPAPDVPTETVARLLGDVETRLDAVWATAALGCALDSGRATGGKLARARLTLATAGAVGLDDTDAVAAATAVELLHNAALIHDDLIDGDTRRRGRRSLWCQHGVTEAVLQGDRLLAAAHGEAARSSAPGRLVPAISATACQLADGAAREGHPTAPDPGAASRSAYLATARAKTGVLFGLTAEAPLLLAHAPDDQQAGLREACQGLGIAYQIDDDMADLTGRKSGRSAGGDLRARRLCAPVAAWRAHADPAQVAALDAYLRDGDDGAGHDSAAWLARLQGEDVQAWLAAWRRDALATAREASAGLPPDLQAIAAWAENLITQATSQPADSSMRAS